MTDNGSCYRSRAFRHCKYHVVFIPKCCRKTLYQELRRHLGEVFRRLALQKESKVDWRMLSQFIDPEGRIRDRRRCRAIAQFGRVRRRSLAGVAVITTSSVG